MVPNPSHFRLKASRVPNFHRGDYTSNAPEEADDEEDEFESINDDEGDISPVAGAFTKTGEVTIENPASVGNPSLAKFHSYFTGSNSNAGTSYMNISRIRETDEEDLDEDSSPSDHQAVLRPSQNIVINH
jgi:hypothetical protein